MLCHYTHPQGTCYARNRRRRYHVYSNRALWLAAFSYRGNPLDETYQPIDICLGGNLASHKHIKREDKPKELSTIAYIPTVRKTANMRIAIRLAFLALMMFVVNGAILESREPGQS